jgi:hypothetical protein
MKIRIYVSEKIRKNYKKITVNTLPEKAEMQSHQNSWNAHCVAIFGKRCWVVTHSITRYTVLIPDVKAADLVNFRFLFLDNMINQLIKNQMVDPIKIQEFIGDVAFYPTNGDRSCIAYNNKRIEEIEYWKSSVDNFEDIPFWTMGSNLNNLGTKLIDGKSKYIRPTQEILKLINEIE